jgi:hypothetical protein
LRPKAVPWLLLVKPAGNVWTLTAACPLASPTSVGWVGGRVHRRLDQHQIYRACYGTLGCDSLESEPGASTAQVFQCAVCVRRTSNFCRL